MKNLYKSLLVISVIFACAGCVTEKKQSDVKGFKLFMQNLTAKYNGYFNANVLLSESFDKLNQQHVDNFTKVLDLYPYVAVDNPKSVAPSLDRAIEKVAMVATLHRASHWRDDCYLLLGKAQFLKHNYESAEESLEFLKDEFDPKNVNKKDKKAVAEAKKETAKEKQEARKDKLKEKEQTLKEKRKESEQKAKDRTKALEEKKKAALELSKAKQKEREQARVEGRKPNYDNLEPSNGSSGKQGVVKTGGNATPVIRGKIKKEKPVTKPKSYFLKHRPCWQEGSLWLAKTYIERKEYDDASDVLSSLDKNLGTFLDIRGQVAMAQAYIHLKQADYEGAIPALEKALKLKNKKSDKMRMYFILGQIQQGMGRNQDAYASFNKVTHYTPSYEMEFNARLNMALCSSASEAETNSKLLAMSKDYKNKEYNDQIYFALAQISLKNGKKKEAEEYLLKSLTIPSKNTQQKAEAYYQLAKMFTESENFVKAKNYYDSTLTILSQTDVRYGEVKRYSENLTDIAKNIQIIVLQDSLLKISAMTEKEKRAFATTIKKAKDDKKAADDLAIKIATGSTANPVTNSGGDSKPAFFAYNPDAVKRGKTAFDKKWGERKLEDNWRRANKRTAGGSSSSGDPQSTDISSGGTDSQLSDKEIEVILKDVPKTKDEIAKAKDNIMEAQFSLGTLYMDKLKNEKKSIEVLEKMLQRFPDTKHELDAWYYLYTAYTSAGNAPKAKEYFDKIQDKYPTSTYARVLKDPKSFEVSKTSTVQSFYDSTYLYFKKGQYKIAAERIAKSDQTFGLNNPFKAKFALIGAMCTGNLQGRDAYKAALLEVIGKYADLVTVPGISLLILTFSSAST